MNEHPTGPAIESKSASAPLDGNLTPAEPNRDSNAMIFGLVAWMIPGLGHLLLCRWTKAAAFFAVIAALIILGCAMRGKVFAPGPDGPLGALGFFADIGNGAFYFLARAAESSRVDISTAAGDYGTRFIAAAGIVNVLAVIDAFETAARRRSDQCK